MSSVIARAARVGVLSGRIVSHPQADPRARRRPYAGVMQAVALRRVTDAAVALALAGLATVELLLPLTSVLGTGSVAVSLAVALVVCGALAFRRTHPLPVVLVVVLVWPVVYSLTPIYVMFWGQFVPLVVALYSVARHGSPRQAVIGVLVGAGGLLFLDLRVPELDSADERVFHWMVCTVAVALGVFVRSYERRAVAQARRAVQAETTSREQVLRAVADERARIARELHDIVAHSVSVIVVQAGAAQKAVDDPVFVDRALESIRTTGTAALQEMRTLVALIKAEDDESELAPQPALADLPSLVSQMSVPTTLVVRGDERPLEAGVALSAYRIVQEALTNVRRHASATSVEVVLTYGESVLEVEVADDGSGAADPSDSHGTPDSSGGNGIIGMRERAQVYGGSVAAISVPGEGFRIRATLPLPPTAPSSSGAHSSVTSP